MKKLYNALGIFFAVSAIIIGSFAFSDEVEKYQNQYDYIVEDLEPLYREFKRLEKEIEEREFKKSHIQCLLAQAKKEKGLEVSGASNYCFTKLP